MCSGALLMSVQNGELIHAHFKFDARFIAVFPTVFLSVTQNICQCNIPVTFAWELFRVFVACMNMVFMYFLILFSLADMCNEDAWVVHMLAAPSQTLLLTLNLNEVIVLDSFLYATLCENDNEVVFGKYKACMHGNVI